MRFPPPPPDMYLCICNNVREGDTEKYHLIGTNCGKCISDGGEQVRQVLSRKVEDRCASDRNRNETQ